MSWRFQSLAFLVVALAACSSDPQRPPPAGDGQTAGGGAGGGGGGGNNQDAGPTDGGNGGDSGVVCNTLANATLVVDRIGIVGDAPVSTGGTIAEGRYELTEYRIYVGAGGLGGPTGVTASSALSVASGRIEQVLKVGGNTPTTETRTITSFNTTASTLLRTNVCPADGAAAQFQFTANDAAITITDTLSKEAFVFTKR
jgi:hypothetical protein